MWVGTVQVDLGCTGNDPDLYLGHACSNIIWNMAYPDLSVLDFCLFPQLNNGRVFCLDYDPFLQNYFLVHHSPLTIPPHVT
jgi:hypothetical protein